MHKPNPILQKEKKRVTQCNNDIKRMQTIFNFTIHWKLTHDGFMLILIDFVIFFNKLSKRNSQEISVLKKKSNIIKKETVRWAFVFFVQGSLFSEASCQEYKAKTIWPYSVAYCKVFNTRRAKTTIRGGVCKKFCMTSIIPTRLDTLH